MSDVQLTPVREAHRFNESALADYLAQHIEDYAGPLEVKQFEGGQSNPTFRLLTGIAGMCCANSRPVNCCRPPIRWTGSSGSCRRCSTRCPGAPHVLSV